MKFIIRFLGACIGIYLILANYGALTALSISIHVGAGLADAGESFGPFWRELGYIGGTALALVLTMALVSGLGAFIGYSMAWALTKIPSLWGHNAS
jgi:hypothetical protein